MQKSKHWQQETSNIKEKMDLDVQVSKLKLLKANHTSQIYRLESDIAKRYPVHDTALKEKIAGMRVDADVVKRIDLQDNDHFAMTVGGKLYTDKKEGGVALISAAFRFEVRKISRADRRISLFCTFFRI